MSAFHFLRPWWLLAFIPLLYLIVQLWRKNPGLNTWRAVCDEHLLQHLIKQQGKSRRAGALGVFFLSAVLMCIGLAGPTWSKFPVPIFRSQLPRILVLDLSPNMTNNDLRPDRLTRAKFKLRDLLNRKNAGQFALVVYTGEPFVVSPLTDDGDTITSLLETLTPEIMPIDGLQLDSALKQAATLITQAGFMQGQILVLTASIPDTAALQSATNLAEKGIITSVMPVIADQSLNPLFQPIAQAGKGMLLPFSDTSEDLDRWLKETDSTQHLSRLSQNEIPLWRDEGHWFIWPALLLLLPVFRRGWLQRIDS